ncbi:hypothetical protein [Streptomyces sp. b94]|nr:hypothetical protein [Streptomyces sp. b94]
MRFHALEVVAHDPGLTDGSLLRWALTGDGDPAALKVIGFSKEN